ncbi:hypothetical protein [Paenibacillus sp. PL2-23]|uniref:hypothetical protein n=1 Tax=Paenibacillus sp. PL2-23 TaxID=2100729 RepID=UPI0030F6C148
MSVDQAYVLTPSDVRNIRSYVSHKYAAMPTEQRAEIVADAVTRIIHKQLPEFGPLLKRELTRTLIRTTVLEQQRPVSPDDIYALCMELDQQDSRIAEPLKRWLREKESQLFHSGTAAIKPLASVEAGVQPLPGQLHPAIRDRRRKRLLLYSLLSAATVAAALLFGWTPPEPPADLAAERTEAPAIPAVAPQPSINELPAELKYAEVNRERLLAFLGSKSSMLAKPQYFDPIMDTAEAFDIHPALLFAITGQEQAFVPITHDQADEIANNPFNVFHSWQAFNTTIEQSSQIAARTIVRLSKDKPAHIDAITWINREYAEDPNWSKGVKSIFRAILAEVQEVQAPV